MAATNELKMYVQEQLHNGVSENVIRQHLASAGWQTSDIDTVFQDQPHGIKKLLPHVYEWIFRIGFATIFLINSYVAIAKPASFEGLLQDSFVLSIFDNLNFWLYVIAANDGLLGLAIVFLGWKYRAIDAWAGVWLLIVTYFKIINL